MKGDPKVISLLNEVLTAELTAINQYFLHAELCEHWGFERLHKRTRKESIEEMKHAEKVIHRILLLDGLPNLQKLGTLNIGQTVPEQLKADLALEMDAVQRLNAAITHCRTVLDNGTCELLEKILIEEEEHIDWLETQLEAIKLVGEQNYLSEQLKEEE
ncbi:MAG: bacterioferritin [Archangiaceae bacterium]|nr:bacterioferritin [Archangiaceae bacterium]